MKITAPVGSQTVDGHTIITWESSGIVQDGLVDIWYSSTYEKSWTLIAHDLVNSGSYDWNTTSVRDGSWYKLRVVGKKNGNRGFDVSKDFFTVDNWETGPQMFTF